MDMRSCKLSNIIQLICTRNDKPVLILSSRLSVNNLGTPTHIEFWVTMPEPVWYGEECVFKNTQRRL